MTLTTIASRAAALLTAAAVAVLTLVVPAGPADAAAYRYWGYYTWTDGEWAFATKGPDATKPADGTVEGWRFAVTTESGSPRAPRADGDFRAICAGTDPAEGRKRVAVVLDAGLPADAPSGEQPPEPRGECALVAVSASGAQVLAAVADARVEKGLVCAIGGYPSTGCGEQVDATPPAKPDAQVDLALPQDQTGQQAGGGSSEGDDSGAGPWLGLGIGAALVLALGVAAVARARTGSRG